MPCRDYEAARHMHGYVWRLDAGQQRCFHCHRSPRSRSLLASTRWQNRAHSTYRGVDASADAGLDTMQSMSTRHIIGHRTPESLELGCGAAPGYEGDCLGAQGERKPDDIDGAQDVGAEELAVGEGIIRQRLVVDYCVHAGGERHVDALYKAQPWLCCVACNVRSGSGLGWLHLRLIRSSLSAPHCRLYVHCRSYVHRSVERRGNALQEAQPRFCCAACKLASRQGSPAKAFYERCKARLAQSALYTRLGQP